MPEHRDITVINAKGLYYRMLNRQIKAVLGRQKNAVIVRNVLGQRYIGCGLNGSKALEIYGTPGQDLGAFLNGAKLIVHGNAQDGVGNTMNDGKIVIHGKAGEIPGHSMRGGTIFIRDDVEYRAGIHMKEYRDKIPVIVVGGTAKDYCGEYMAGGRIVVLNRGEKPGSPVGYDVGTGIHGGIIYVRGPVDDYQLGIGAVVAAMDDDDRAFLTTILAEYSADLGMHLGDIAVDQFTKITKKGHRPFANLYTPGMNLKTEKPRHFNLTPPCMNACPTGIPTPVFLNLIKDGKVQDAQRLMDEYTPFRMSVCGTVCPAPCMDACTRNAIDSPVALRDIARQYYPSFRPTVAKTAYDERVAVIGAGPAGLSTAWQLARRGYTVTIYEGRDDIGGKLRAAIPRDRLPDAFLKKDLERIRSLPIAWHVGAHVDATMMESIRAENDAVLIATGASVTRRIAYPGGERIQSGLSFLTDINEGTPRDMTGQSVVIIGAGNVGMDIACEAWRLGAKQVTAVDIQKPLAFGQERDAAMERGTRILWPKTVKRLDKKHMYFTDGTRLTADTAFFSIGETPDTSYLPESVFVDERGYVGTGDRSFQTSDAKVFACGDIVRQGLVTDAVGMGRLAAMEVHSFLRGEPFAFPEKRPVAKSRIRTAYFGGETEEVDRCISCGTCILCDTCIDMCPQEALSRNGDVFTVDTDRCTLCYTCISVCPRGAIQVEDITGTTPADEPAAN